MLHVRVLRVRLDQVGRLTTWLRELTDRADEVRETFAHEGVRHEQAHLVSTSEGPLLVYAFEADDVEAAFDAYARSTLPIDLEHAATMEAAIAGPADSECLLDLRAEPPP